MLTKALQRAVLAILLLGPNLAVSGPLQLGSLLVSDPTSRALLSIDPITGYRRVFSSDTTGDGPSFINPAEITVSNDGTIYVIDGRSVFTIDPENGDRTIVSGPETGSGRLNSGLRAMAIRPNGRLLVADNRGDFLIIDPESGERWFRAHVGGRPTDITVNADGDILFSRSEELGIGLLPATVSGIQTSPPSKLYTVLMENAPPEGSAINLGDTQAFVQIDGNELILLDRWSADRLKHVNLDTNDRIGLLRGGKGLPDSITTYDLLLKEAGTLWVTGSDHGLLEVDLVAKDWKIISGREIGGGSDFRQLYKMAIFVPEPNTDLSIVMLASLILSFQRSRTSYAYQIKHFDICRS